MRQATTTRTWNDGETTTHYWAEIPSEPGNWLEFDRLIEPDEWDQVQERADGIVDGKQTRTFPIRAVTRYLQMFSDTIKFHE